MDKSPSPILISQYFCLSFIKQQYVISYPHGNSTSNYHQLFSWKPSHTSNTKVITYVSSIWKDDRIERLENNQWKCLWCNVIFQGINATKSVARVIRTKFMHINRFRYPIDKKHLSWYKYLQLIKSDNNSLIDDYSHKIISSVLRLQDNSWEAVESNIERNSRSMSSSNINATYYT